MILWLAVQSEGPETRNLIARYAVELKDMIKVSPVGKWDWVFKLKVEFLGAFDLITKLTGPDGGRNTNLGVVEAMFTVKKKNFFLAGGLSVVFTAVKSHTPITPSDEKPCLGGEVIGTGVLLFHGIDPAKGCGESTAIVKTIWNDKTGKYELVSPSPPFSWLEPELDKDGKIPGDGIPF